MQKVCVCEEIKKCLFEIYLVWSDSAEGHVSPIKHYATFANIELVNVTSEFI